MFQAKENLNDKHEKLKKEEMKTSEKLKVKYNIQYIYSV